MAEPWIALGLDLRLLTAEEGGRKTPISAPEPFSYRPDWRLPGLTAEMSGAPVLCFSRPEVAPGDAVRAVVLPLFDVRLPVWRAVSVGDELVMCEGPRACGVAVVSWSEQTELPLPARDEARFRRWAESGADLS